VAVFVPSDVDGYLRYDARKITPLFSIIMFLERDSFIPCSYYSRFPTRNFVVVLFKYKSHVEHFFSPRRSTKIVPIEQRYYECGARWPFRVSIMCKIIEFLTIGAGTAVLRRYWVEGNVVNATAELSPCVISSVFRTWMKSLRVTTDGMNADGRVGKIPPFPLKLRISFVDRTGRPLPFRKIAANIRRRQKGN